MEKHLCELGFDCAKEFKFHDQRRWKFDFLLLAHRIAVEIEGAVWTQGRHTRGSGFVKDMEKYNTATMMGYRVLRFSTQDVLSGKAKQFLQQYLGDS